MSRIVSGRARVLWTALLGMPLVALLLSLWALRPPPRLAVPPPDVELAGVTLVQPGEGRHPDSVVVVRGGRIARIGLAAGAADARLAGRFVLPGLVDLHVHHPPSLARGERELFALLFLTHGVTTVRDVGSFGGDIFAHRARLAAGQLAGPRVYACGAFLDGEPAGWPGARVVGDPEAARAAVEDLARSGADCVKVYNRVTPAVLNEILRTADSLELPVVAHVPWSVGLRALAGTEVQHLMGLSDEWEVPLNQVIRYVETSRMLEISHTPTLVVFERAARLGDLAALRREPVAHLLPRHYRELLWDPARNPLVLDLVPGFPGDLANRLVVMQEVVARLHRAGVPVLAGSDTMNPFVVPGASLQSELRLLVEAGLTPEEAWRAATSAAGTALRVPGLGRLEEGAPADLLVFREDPTRDLAALATLEAVVAGGRLYPRDALEAALRRQRAHFERPLRELLQVGFVRAALAGARYLGSEN